MARLDEFFGRAVGDPALARINKAYYDEFRDGLAAIIRRQQREGKLSRKVDPAVTGDAIISILDGFSIRATLEPGLVRETAAVATRSHAAAAIARARPRASHIKGRKENAKA